SPAGDDIYGGKISRSVAAMEKDERGGMSATEAGKQIADLCCKKHPAPVYTIGGVYKLFVFLTRLFPQRFLYYVVGKLY
ncbi:MAG TPA: short-chain dehydrogenase, partial [Clostridiales bacterium]|nr:short-chain dehydrogenase [Clostridiales bacterium]